MRDRSSKQPNKSVLKNPQPGLRQMNRSSHASQAAANDGHLDRAYRNLHAWMHKHIARRWVEARINLSVEVDVRVMALEFDCHHGLDPTKERGRKA